MKLANLKPLSFLHLRFFLFLASPPRIHFHRTLVSNFLLPTIPAFFSRHFLDLVTFSFHFPLLWFFFPVVLSPQSRGTVTEAPLDF